MLTFGLLRLRSNLFLSPLAGYTNLPFRLTIRELGGLDLATTDLVNARSLLEKNQKALQLIETDVEDCPLAVQLFGSVAEEMREAALFLQERGIASVDINMGCPVRKVCRVGIALQFVPTGILSVFGRVFLLEGVGGMSLWTAESWRKPPYITSAWTRYVITLLPVIGLIQMSSQAWADHYAYLALTGDFCMDCISGCGIGGGGFLKGWRALGWWFFCR